ncbi:hypothetical protein [Nocardia stercoris]|uniref:hypothetical protein n=1 Tax=Nocardia stercoris TaxID=2483361 RepID=UPI001F267B67|nr:hypothetical protein [Nocardia stercoris]
MPIADTAPNEVAVGWRGDNEAPLVRSFVDIARTVRDAHPELIARLQKPDCADRIVPAQL